MKYYILLIYSYKNRAYNNEFMILLNFAVHTFLALMNRISLRDGGKSETLEGRVVIERA